MKLDEPFTNRTRPAAFTFIELLVVLAVIALLAAIVLPVLAGTTESSLRTQCLNNLRQIGIGITVGANDNNGFLVSAKPTNNGNNIPGTPPFVQFAISVNYTNELNAAGIPLVTNAPSVWSCPEIPGLPYPDTVDFPQWFIGYQYFGGFTKWTPPNGLTITGHSPVKLTQSQPYWCLAADLAAKVFNKWGGVEASLPMNIQAGQKTWPPHRQGTNAYPAGANEVFVDGSASWCKIDSMYALTTWNTAYKLWFYQSTEDIPSFQLNGLKWNPAVDSH